MNEAERLALKMEAADFRERARVARADAALPGLQPWRTGLLNDSADYYDRRADDADQRLSAASHTRETAEPPAGERV